MNKLVSIALCVMATSSFAQDDDPSLNNHQFGLEVQQIKVAGDDPSSSQYVDSDEFISLFKKTLNASAFNQMSLKLMATTPMIYKAAINATKINEMHRIETKLDSLVSLQRETNALMNKLLSKDM